jgi:hypothetical protein
LFVRYCRFGQARTADIAELAVLKDKELFAARQLVQAADGLVVEVGDDVCVGLEDANVIADIFGEGQQFVCGGDVGGDAQVGALEVDEAEEIGGQRGEIGIF